MDLPLVGTTKRQKLGTDFWKSKGPKKMAAMEPLQSGGDFSGIADIPVVMIPPSGHAELGTPHVEAEQSEGGGLSRAGSDEFSLDPTSDSRISQVKMAAIAEKVPEVPQSETLIIRSSALQDHEDHHAVKLQSK